MKKTQKTNKVTEISKEYTFKQQLYAEFARTIRDIVRQIILDAEIKEYSITYREKNPRKLRIKILKKFLKGIPYKKLEDIEDLAGVRVVTYLESHKDQIANLIYREFHGAIIESEDKYDPQGYRGAHFIIQLDKEREKLPEYRRYKGLKCEIQITSILYHAWSEIEHGVIYKPEDNRKKLESFGLDEIEHSFQKIMAKHLEQATIQFDLLNKKYKEILKAGKIIGSDFTSDIRNAQSNDEISPLLDIAEKFSHKKPEESMQMIEEIIKRTPIDPKVIHKIGEEEIFGKDNDDLLKRCVTILLRIRYWNVERSLSILFYLSKNQSKEIAEKAIEAIRNTVRYDHAFLKKQKTLYPQQVALKFIKKISVAEHKEYFQAITTVATNILSSSVEGSEWSDVDTITYHSGALVPNEGLKKIRQETIDFVAKLYKQSLNTQDKLTLIRTLLTTLNTPSNIAYGDDLIKMIFEDSKILLSIFTKIIFTGKKVNDHLVVQEIEESLARLLRSDHFKSKEAEQLYKKIRDDSSYTIFRIFFGSTHEYKNLDENLDEVEKRRSREVHDLVKKVTNKTANHWYAQLNNFAEPLQKGFVDIWKYGTFKIFIARLTTEKPNIANNLFLKAHKENSYLCQEPLITTYLSTLRRENNLKLWDKFVEQIQKKKSTDLFSSIVYSLNLDSETNLKTSIRNEDIEILAKLIRAKKPFIFVDNNNDFTLRYALINTLSRIFIRAPSQVESLIIEEVTNHPERLSVYFGELPFASHRKWMSFKKWSKPGIEFLKEKLIQLDVLDWQTQGMLLELTDNPIKIILDIFMGRIQRNKKEKGGNRYEEVPYDFNPDLQKYLAGHDKYITEMVKWLKNMELDINSLYNWHVSHFIQRIDGASFATILMKLIESENKDSLKKAAYALDTFEGADFGICFEIVKRTDDKNILDHLAGVMSSTGIVSGEDGLARAYDSKANNLKEYLKSKDKRVKTFATEMKRSFEERAQKERQRSSIEKKTRKIEFEEM